MCNQEKIRREAFRHLDDFVRGELRYLVDNNYPLESFNMGNMLENYLSEEERLVVENSLRQLRSGDVMGYCTQRGIEIPDQLNHQML